MAQLEVYYVKPEDLDENEGRALIRDEEAHHLFRVRRARPGDPLTLIDGRGSAWGATVSEIGKQSVLCQLNASYPHWREPSAQLHIGLGLIKPDHFLDAVNLATQLGASAFTPLNTERSVSGWSENKARRANRVALTAAKQCGRGLVPPVSGENHLHDWCIEMEDVAVKLVADEEGDPAPPLSSEQRCALAIGPEGGFTEQELELLRGHGFRGITLGVRRLRSETAAITATALLLREDRGITGT